MPVNQIIKDGKEGRSILTTSMLLYNSKEIRKSILLVIFIPIGVVHCIAQSVNKRVSRAYYVSIRGNDANPGTISKPFQTIDRINALGELYSDTIYFSSNELFEGTLKIHCWGNSNKRCLIAGYGKGQAIINGKNNEALIISGTCFTIKNLKLKGSGRKNGNTKNGFSIIDSKDGKIYNVQVDSFQKAGVSAEKCQGLSFKYVIARHNGFAGISLSESKNCDIKDCRAENNPGDPSNLTNHSGNGIIVGFCDHILIDHCTATNNGWDMPRLGNGPVGIWGYESDSVIIQYCISYRNRTAKGASDGGGFDLDGGMKNSIIQYCISYENEGSGYGIFQYNGASAWVNNKIRYCISINDAKKTKDAAGILVWNDSGDSSQLSKGYIYNNLIYNDSTVVIGFLSESVNKELIFCNNILAGTKKMIVGPESGDQFIGNVYWSVDSVPLNFRGYYSLKEWRNNTRQEQFHSIETGINADPKLTGPIITQITDPYQLQKLTGYKLKRNSSIIHKGIALNIEGLSQPKIDFYNNKIDPSVKITPGIEQISH